MRDSRPAALPALPAALRTLAGPPAARLLLVMLGLLGFVVGPVGAGAHAGTSATGAISGVRTVPAAKAPTRIRSAAKTRSAPRTGTSPHARGVPRAQAAPRTPAVIDAVARHAAGTAAPTMHPVHAVLPASGTDAPPPAGRLRRPAAAPPSPDLAPPAAPRGRAPPSTARTRVTLVRGAAR
ncbi:hypothetical protein [Actinomadura bangladeshensis]|uniref:Uncharacterized protein n=1 Tax=Actinomadura bangladeshensis TaxID=453573 RepID=A0A4R4NXV0_9ACTN|nr:hypothetical protein [Actinomadura bangladeshensis]TDC12312.1 hypothetical protein E1284_24025 [Actinomadura bangladeshensis]